MSHCIDLNCDIGEGFGTYAVGDDLAVLDCVSSVNIACGFHAGDPPTMLRVVDAAIRKGVHVGAHPGLPDMQGFGRREMLVSPTEVYAMTVYQVGALAGFAAAAGGALSHVKAHGALYDMTARDRSLAQAMAQAVHDVNPWLVLFGQAGSETIAAADGIGLRSASEVFADRGYCNDGSLAPRGEFGAQIEDPELAAAQALRMVTQGTVRAISGREVRVRAETLCIQGGQPDALTFARRIRADLHAAGVAVAAPAVKAEVALLPARH
jgi:UPF0271 protein